MDITALVTSTDATEKGREFAFGADAKLVIAASGNTTHRKALRRLYEPHSKALAFGGSIDPETAKAIDDEAMAEGVLVGWSGITKDGDPLAYSKENALWLLRNVALLRKFVVSASEDAALFTVGAVEAVKDVLKKS
jgi:hypothetical protein